MDATTSRLVDFISQSQFAHLSQETVHQCKRRLIDTFACAIGAFDEPLSLMARSVAMRHMTSSAAPGARVWGCAWRAAPEAAAFANGVMLRVQDISDMYRVKSGGHPSDVIAAVVSAGEFTGASGASVINAVTLAYDIYCTFCEAVNINTKGWDQPVYGVIAATAGAGKLLGLSRDQMGNAISLALAPNMALRQTRNGRLSSWKGCAGANASRNALFAALLAKDGFSGPESVFEGQDGLWDIVGKFDWSPSLGPESHHRIARTHMKCFPVCYHGQSAVWAAIDIRERLNAQEIREIEIDTYELAVRVMGNDSSRWSPANRETADHSLPYVVATGLLNGEVTSSSFSDKRLTDPQTFSLMRRIKVRECADLTALYPESAPCRLKIHLASGDRIVTEVRYPKGHINNPMNDAELDSKFRGMYRQFSDETRCESALNQLWNLDSAADIALVLNAFVRADERSPGAGGHQAAG